MKLSFSFCSCFLFIMATYSQSDWGKPIVLQRNAKEAELIYRYGDVDDLNQGWEPGFNPFSGKTTHMHSFPFSPAKTDPEGTDCVMVGSAYDYNSKNDKDGYTSTTKRPGNLPKVLHLIWNESPSKTNNIVLQVFVDDFQTYMFKKSYQVSFDGERIPYLEAVINSLAQSGPVGKLITIDILPEYFHFFEDGKLDFFIDDPYTKNGDGYAIDFVQLLINTKNKSKGTVTGTVINYTTQKPLDSVLVTASSGVQTYSDKDGKFTLNGITSGLAVINGAKIDFEQNYITTDVDEVTVTPNIKLQLKPRSKDNAGTIKNNLLAKGKIDLYGIQFDVNSDKIKSSSLPSLNELAGMIKQNSQLKIELSGHTDADGDEKVNQLLSEKRIQAALNWLKENNAPLENVSTKGYGESKPVASNATGEGKQLNRRVEIKLIQ